MAIRIETQGQSGDGKGLWRASARAVLRFQQQGEGHLAKVGQRSGFTGSGLDRLDILDLAFAMPDEIEFDAWGAARDVKLVRERAGAIPQIQALSDPDLERLAKAVWHSIAMMFRFRKFVMRALPTPY